MNTTRSFSSVDPGEETISLTVSLAQTLLIQLVTTESKLQVAREELRGIHETMANAQLAPADKVLAILALEHVGAAPRRPSPYRLTEYVPVSLGELADKMGMSAKQISARLRGQCDAGLLRMERYTTRTDDGMPRQHVKIAPPDGAAWEATWATPARIGPIASPTTAKERDRKARERALVRAILAQCPNCGATCLDIRCHTCGVITPVDAMPDAPHQHENPQTEETSARVR